MLRSLSSLSLVAALALAVSSLAPVPACAQDRQSVHHADRGLVGAGATILSLAWGANTLGAFAASAVLDVGSSELGISEDGAYALSLVPVVGPILWGAMVRAPAQIDQALYAAFAYTDAAFQALGLGLLIAGLVGVDEPIGEVADGVRVLPFAGGDRAGLRLDARW